jgi:ABC-2 type transport system ATP-binding protein
MKISDGNIINLLKEFKLHNRLNVVIKKLSGGQKQKLNIMIAFLNNPKVLIFDEILTGLDLTSQNDVTDSILVKLKNDPKLTMVIVSHNAKEIELMAKRLIVIKNGRIINDASVKELIAEYKSLDNYLGTLRETDE